MNTLNSLRIAQCDCQIRCSTASNFIFINYPGLHTIFEITPDKKNIRYLIRYYFDDLYPLIASISEVYFAIGRKEKPIVIIKFDDLREQPPSDHHEEKAKELSDIFAAVHLNAVAIKCIE